VIEPEFPEAKDESFQEHLHYFLNFPADDMLTVYKWNLLLRLFGPYDQFTYNFRTLVLERGFLGLINRIKVCNHRAYTNARTHATRTPHTHHRTIAHASS
jgi:hypothetical protein